MYNISLKIQINEIILRISNVSSLKLMSKIFIFNRNKNSYLNNKNVIMLKLKNKYAFMKIKYKSNYTSNR